MGERKIALERRNSLQTGVISWTIVVFVVMDQPRLSLFTLRQFIVSFAGHLRSLGTWHIGEHGSYRVL